MKKTISLFILIFIFTVSECVLPVYSEQSANIIINETFDDIDTNGKPNNVVINNGLNGRVIEKKAFDKALYVKSWGSRAKVSAPISYSDSHMVFSADIKFKGEKPRADILKIKMDSGKEVSLLQYSEDGKIKLEDGKIIGGVQNDVWKRVTAIVDFDNKTYDIYIDNKNIVKKWYFKTDISKPQEIIFELISNINGNGTEFFLDNFRVYTGKTILGDNHFPKKTPSSKTIEFTEISEKPDVNKIYINSNGSENLNYSLVPKAGTVATWQGIDGQEGQFLRLARTEGTLDAYCDLSLPSDFQNADYFIYEVEVYPVELNGTVNLGRLVSPDNLVSNLFELKQNGELYANGVKSAELSMSKWTNVSAICDMSTKTYSLYINSVLVKEKIPMSGGGVYAKKIRLAIYSGSAGKVDIYFNKIKVYGGFALRNLDEEESENITDESQGSINNSVDTNSNDKTSTKYKNYMETEQTALKAIDGSVVFMTSADSYFIKNTKQKYSDTGLIPYVDKSVFMVPSQYIEDAFNVNTAINNDEISIGNKIKMRVGSTEMYVNGKILTLPHEPVVKDSVVYLPLRAVAEQGLEKYAYEDDRGFLLFSNSKRDLKNQTYADMGYMQEQSDIIFRYMYFPRPGGKNVIKALKTNSPDNMHPRILTTPDRLEEVRANIASDNISREMFENTVSIADEIIDNPLIEYKIESDGFRLFGSCISVRNALIPLCTAYKLTGDEKYAERAWREVENACNWKDWNVKGHFLDSGKIGPGIAVAYDMLYDYLTPEQRKFVRNKTMEHYLDFCVTAFEGNYSGSPFARSTSNWGSVCCGSILMVCLSMCDDAESVEELEKYEYLIEQSMQGLEYQLELISPDGSWFEGMGYWTYVMGYLSWSAGALQNSCGTNYGMMDMPGMQRISDFGYYVQSPSKGAIPFGAQMESSQYYLPSQLFELAYLLNSPEKMSMALKMRKSFGVEMAATDVLWYEPVNNEKTNEFPLDNYFSVTDIGVMRSNWSSPQSTYLFITAGQNIPATNGNAGSHFHRGGFVFEALNERWSLDLGYSNADKLSGAFYGKQGWNIYDRRPEGHNCIVINPDDTPGQALVAKTTLVKSESKPKGGYMVIDLHDAYPDSTESMLRGFYFGDDRQTLTIRDEIKLNKQSDVYWFMHTRAKIDIDEDGKGATLTQNGKQLRAEVLCNADAWKLEVRQPVPFETSPVREEGQAEHKGVTKLTVVAKGDGEMTITVKLMPVLEYSEFEPVKDTPISEWTIPDGEISEKPLLEGITIDGEAISEFNPEIFSYDVNVEYLCDPPSGDSLPKINAISSSASVEVKQSNEFGVPSKIILTGPNGNKSQYVVTMHGTRVLEIIKDGVASNITNAVSEGMAPVAGDISGYKLIDINNIYASSVPQIENPPQNLFDDNLDTRWASDTNGAWVELDLGASVKIDGIALGYMLGSKRVYNYEILVSDDKKNYKRLYKGGSTGTTDGYEILPVSCQARYVVYRGYGNNENAWNSITEIRPFVKK